MTTHSSRGFFVSGQQQQIGLPVLIPTFFFGFSGSTGAEDPWPILAPLSSQYTTKFSKQQLISQQASVYEERRKSNDESIPLGLGQNLNLSIDLLSSKFHILRLDRRASSGTVRSNYPLYCC